MSTSNPPVETAPTTVEKKESKDAEFLGINFNNPLALGGLLFIGIPAGYFFINLLKGFLFKEPAAPQPVRRIPRPSAEELRQAEYQRNLDLQNQRQQLSREQEYYENLKRYGVVEQNNNNLKQYNVHKNFEPEPYIENENMIDVIDDNMIDYNNYVFNKDVHRQPFVVERPQQQLRQQQRRQQDLPPQPQEDSLLISAEEIDTYTDTDDIDTSRIPPEFVSVGNRPAAFENIQPVDRRGQEQQDNKDDDIYNLDNYEISEKELKEMEANAMNNSSEYYK